MSDGPVQFVKLDFDTEAYVAKYFTTAEKVLAASSAHGKRQSINAITRR